MKRRAPKTDVRPFPRWAQILIAVVWLAAIVFCYLHRDRFTVEGIGSLDPGSTALAILMMLGSFALKSLSIVLYSGILYAACGVLFPLPLAIPVCLCGTAVMATIPYLLGKRMGAAAVDRIVGKYPNAGLLKRLPSENAYLFSLMLRAVGLLPMDVVSAYLGAVSTPYLPYLLGTLTGMAASCVLFPILGMSITSRDTKQFLIAAAVHVLIAGGCALAIFLLRRKDETPPPG